MRITDGEHWRGGTSSRTVYPQGAIKRFARLKGQVPLAPEKRVLGLLGASIAAFGPVPLRPRESDLIRSQGASGLRTLDVLFGYHAPAWPRMYPAAHRIILNQCAATSWHAKALVGGPVAFMGRNRRQRYN